MRLILCSMYGLLISINCIISYNICSNKFNYLRFKRHRPRASCRRGTRREVHALSSSYQELKFYRQDPFGPCIARPKSRRLDNQQAEEINVKLAIFYGWMPFRRNVSHAFGWGSKIRMSKIIKRTKYMYILYDILYAL